MNVKELFDLSGRTAVVTGGYTGIGKQMALALAEAGADVVVCARNLDGCVSAAEEISKSTGVKTLPLKCDVSSEADVIKMVADTAARFGKLDILVNNAGIAMGGLPEDTALEDWEKVLRINLTGTFLFTHAVIPVMKRHKSGKIVNLASIAGRGKSSASSSAYAAAKGGIIALTTKLANELGPYGINVNAIAPATTLTERIRPRWEQRPPEERQADIERTPLRRMGEAVDQANVVCFLASSHADFVTGLTIDVTGGL